MKILVYTMNWHPFVGSVTHVIEALVMYLQQQGHSINILTSIPHFMSGREERWELYKGKFFIMEQWKGIKIIRTFVLSPYSMRSFRFLLKLINYISFSLTSFLASFFIGEYDMIITISHPPLFIGLTSFMISRIKRCGFIYCLEDIYPDILVELKIVKEGLILKLLKRLELFIYNKTKKICVLSPQMKENLNKKGIPTDKIVINPHFPNLDEINPLPKVNPFSQKYKLESKFVILLPGSISYRFDIDTLLDVARKLLSDQNIQFVFIERGELKEIIKQKVESQRLTNIRFFSFQPQEAFSQLLASSDACIVSLDKEFSSYSVPSKIYTIMASARPVIAIVDETSEVAKIVHDAECGVIIPPRQPELLAQEINELSQNREWCAIMGKKGRDFAERELNKDKICKKYKEVIYSAVTS